MGQYMGLLILVIETWSCLLPGMGMAMYNWMKSLIETTLLSDALSLNSSVYALTNAQKCEFESAK